MKEAVKSKFSYPLSLERSYAKQMVNYTSQFIKIIEDYIPDMVRLIEAEQIRMDDDKSRIEVLIDRIEKSIASIQGFKGKASKLYDMVDRHSSRQFDEAMKNAIGRAFIPNYKPKDFETLKRVWVDENLSYIKSIEHDALERIRSVLNEKIIDTVETASLSSELSKSIQAIAHNTKSRAVLIATDQVGKLNGRLMQYRQQHAGIEQYKWSSSHDRRVRPLHRQHDGQVYSWDKPPTDGHPGHAIRCRCVAIPVIDFDNLGAGKSQSMKNNTGKIGFNLQLFARKTDKIPTVQLAKTEYAHVMSELNTNLSKGERAKKLVTKAIGNYLYTFENHGFDDYRIIRKVLIDGDSE